MLIVFRLYQKLRGCTMGRPEVYAIAHGHCVRRENIDQRRSWHAIGGMWGRTEGSYHGVQRRTPLNAETGGVGGNAERVIE